MKIAVFSTKPYDKEYFEKFKNDYGFQLIYFEASLNQNTSNLTKDFDVVCVFVNDKIDKATIEVLSEKGVKLIALRCAGYNNIDLNAVK